MICVFIGYLNYLFLDSFYLNKLELSSFHFLCILLPNSYRKSNEIIDRNFNAITYFKEIKRRLENF